MRFLVVGAGAVGGYFGAKLVQAGKDVDFLVRPGRTDVLTHQRLALVEPDGSRTSLPIRAVTTDQLSGIYDVVLLAVKGPALDSVTTEFAPYLASNGAVLPLMNGVAHLSTVGSHVAPERVLGGVCIVVSQLDDDGAIHHLLPGGSITFGELDGQSSERVMGLNEELAPAAFDSAVSLTIEQDMWEKWFFMAAGGAAGILLDGPAGRITSVDGGHETVSRVMDEALTVISAAGHKVRPPAQQRVSNALISPESSFTTSLYRDFRAGRPTSEVETILGDLTRLGDQLGVATPLLSAAAARIRVSQLVAA